MQKNWNEFLAGRKSGINFAIIDEVNGSVVSVNNFNQQRDDSDSLGKFIERIPPGRIVCVAVSGRIVYSTNDYAKRSMM